MVCLLGAIGNLTILYECIVLVHKHVVVLVLVPSPIIKTTNVHTHMYEYMQWVYDFIYVFVSWPMDVLVIVIFSIATYFDRNRYKETEHDLPFDTVSIFCRVRTKSILKCGKYG